MSIKLIIIFSNTFDNDGKTLVYNWPESFTASEKLLFLMVSLIQLNSSKKQISLFFSTLASISPAVALSEGKLFTTSLTVASETHWKENFLLNLEKC